MDIPSYIAMLERPRGTREAPDRRAFGMRLSTTWIPYYTATNVVGKSHLAPETLGAPLRLRLRDGEVQFTKDGRPSITIAKELRAAIANTMANVEGEMQAFVGLVQQQAPDAYRAQVDSAQQAGEPIQTDEQRLVAEAIVKAAIAAANAKAAIATAAQPPPPDGSAPQPLGEETPTPPVEDAPASRRRSREAVAA